MNIDDILSQSKQRNLRPIEIEEWGVTLYARKASFAKMMEMSKNVKNIEGNSVTFDTDEVIDTLIEYICDDKGAAVFTEKHRDTLAAEDFSIIIRLYKGVVNSQSTVEDAAKN